MYVQRKHKLITTEHAKNTLRARFSLRETQVEFARRFMVSWRTVHKWETGKSKVARPIHQHILKLLLERLEAEGRLLPAELFETMYREALEANADRTTHRSLLA